MSEKNKIIVIRVSECERKSLEDLSEKLYGKSNKSRLIRKIFRGYLDLGVDLIPEELNLFGDTVRQLTGIARNLNQITKKLHVFGINEHPLTNELLKQIFNIIECTNHELKSYIRKSVYKQDNIL